MVDLLKGIGDPTDPGDLLTYDEFDAELILEYLQWKDLTVGQTVNDPGPPPSANEDEFAFAHDNPRAWKLLPDRLPGGFDKKHAIAVMELYANRSYVERRKFPLAIVNRRVQLDPNPCKQCQANTDPRRVPVHPGCQCSVKTDSIEKPDQGPSDEDIRNFAQLLSKVDTADPGAIRADFAFPGPMTVRPETITAIDETFRFADLLAFVSDHEDLLNNASSVVGLFFDNEDLAEETESGTANLVFINDLLEAGTEEVEEAFTPNITRSLKPRSVIMPPNATASELSLAYRMFKDAKK